MNRNALRTIIAFSIVIQIISIVLFYFLVPSDTGFIPTIISFVVALSVTLFALFSYKKHAIEEGFTVNVPLILACLLGSEVIAIGVRVIVLITQH